MTGYCHLCAVPYAHAHACPQQQSQLSKLPGVKDSSHPMQPLIVVDGRVRFKANAIVRDLFERGVIKISQVIGVFPQEDLDQLYQLIGYSVDGYDELVGSEIISEEAAVAAAHAMCRQFGTQYSRCLDEDGCPVHKAKK